MQRTLLRSTAVVAGLLSAVPVVAGAATSAKTPSVLTCAGKATIKPTSFTISCADANIELTAITWSTWGATSAKGTATLHENTCQPNCVAGKFVNYPATLTFSKPTSVSTGLLFSNISYTYAKPVTTSQKLPLTAIPQGGGGGA